MDQYLSTVIIAGLTGIFSIITLIIQKRQDRIINKIDEQTMFIEKEKGLKQKLMEKERDREDIIQEIMVLILDTNLHLLRNIQIAGAETVDEKVFDSSDELKKRLTDVSKSIKDITREYEMVLDMTSEFQKELEKVQKKK